MSARSVAQLSVQGWWDGLAERRLLLLRCDACNERWLPWMPFCPECGRGPGSTAIEASGLGTLQSWVEIHYSVSFPDETPFVVASVQLQEGPVLYGRLQPDVASIASADMPVEARFVERHGFGFRRQVD